MTLTPGSKAAAAIRPQPLHRRLDLDDDVLLRDDEEDDDADLSNNGEDGGEEDCGDIYMAAGVKGLAEGGVVKQLLHHRAQPSSRSSFSSSEAWTADNDCSTNDSDSA